MACPSGCINGGGQIKPGQMREEGMDARELLDALEMRIGSMDQKRVLKEGGQGEDVSMKVIKAVCAEFPQS